jgi:ferric-dicitrate binding protein FerR (iron transport regulator)
VEFTDQEAPMPSEPIRVGDRERADAAERLSAHAAAGRLTVEELEERLERAQRAVVASDLRALEADLPAPGSPQRRRPPWPPLAALAVACVAATVLISLAVGHPVPPLLLVALLLWRAGVRPYRFAPRRLP